MGHSKVKKVPLRSEIEESDKWNLKPLYSKESDWEKDFEFCKLRYLKIQEYRGKLKEGADVLFKCLELDKELDFKMERLGHYAMLQISEDGANADYLQRTARLQNLATLMSEATTFISPEIQALDDTTFENYLKDPVLAPWVNRLRKLRRFKPHTLSESEERLMALGRPILEGYDEAFSQLTNVDMKFGNFSIQGEGEIELSHGVYSSLMEQKNPEVRKEAFHQYYREFDDHKYTLAATLSNSVKGDVFYARARNYPSALEASLFPDAVAVSVYDNLISTVRDHLPVLHEYYQLRKKILKLKEIHHYDTYVPLVADVKKKTTFDEAVNLVLKALEPLGDEYVSVLRKGLTEERWCDRYETKGKRGGAFSSHSYGNYPYMLMNYKEDVFGDVYTLAHEGGHSMHSWFCQRNQTFQDYQYPIFLAEVASTFNEELLTHYFLKTTEDPKMKAYIISRQIDDIRGTVLRQTMFAEFEKRIHEMEENGEALTLDSFRSEYKKLLDAYFGKDFVIDPELSLECLRIPHFYSAFYVYKYATGLSAAVALSQRVLSGGEGELQDYLSFLKSAGTRYPIETLQKAGVDMSTPKPIEETLKLFKSRVLELEKILSA